MEFTEHNFSWLWKFKVLIGKKEGPKLAYLIDAIGRDKVIERFREV